MNQSVFGSEDEEALRRIQYAVIKTAVLSLGRAESDECIKAMAFMYDDDALGYWCAGLSLDPEYVRDAAVRVLRKRFGTDKEIFAGLRECAGREIRAMSRNKVQIGMVKKYRRIYLKLRIAERKGKELKEVINDIAW
jgi:hypothetical protein